MVGRRRAPRRTHAYGGRRKQVMNRFAPSKWPARITLCPDRQYVRLKYSETLNFVQGQTVGDSIFRGNCHIDCNAGAPGVGFSAYGAAQWSTFYGRAYCTSSSIRLKALTDQQNTVQVTVFPSNSFFPVQSSQLAAQRPRKRSTLLSQFTDTKTLGNQASTKAIIGNSRQTDWNYVSNTVAASFPIADWYWHIVTELEAGVAGPMTILVEIDYHVVFFDRKQVLGPVDTTGEIPV